MNDYLPLIICVACARWRAPNNMHLFEGFCPSFYFSRPFKKRRFYLVRFFRFILSAFFVRAVLFIAPFRLPFKKKKRMAAFLKGWFFWDTFYFEGRITHLSIWTVFFVLQPLYFIRFSCYKLTQIFSSFRFFCLFGELWHESLTELLLGALFFPFFSSTFFFFEKKGGLFHFALWPSFLKTKMAHNAHFFKGWFFGDALYFEEQFIFYLSFFR